MCEHDDASGEKEDAELQEDRDACDTSSDVPHPQAVVSVKANSNAVAREGRFVENILPKPLLDP